MSAVFAFFDFVAEATEPPNARAANVLVLESLHDLESTILEVCEEPALVARRFPVALVPRRASEEPQIESTESHPRQE